MDENKYENIIKNYTDTQLIYEIAIKNEEYKTIVAQKKALEEETKRRLRS